MTHDPLRDSKSDLLDAARAAVKDSEEKAVGQAIAARAVPRRRRRRLGVLMSIGMVGLLLLALQPAWLGGPATVQPDPPPVAAAGLRVALIQQRQRVLDYAKAHGRLPVSLVETGDTMPGVFYHRRGDTAFTLTGSAGGSVVVLRSSDSQAVFLGNSLRVIKNRGGQ